MQEEKGEIDDRAVAQGRKNGSDLGPNKPRYKTRTGHELQSVPISFDSPVF